LANSLKTKKGEISKVSFEFFGSNRSQVSLQVVESDIGSVGLNWHFGVEADLLPEFTVCLADYLAHLSTDLEPMKFLKKP